LWNNGYQAPQGKDKIQEQKFANEREKEKETAAAAALRLTTKGDALRRNKCMKRGKQRAH
jgi:hypothetical protein